MPTHRAIDRRLTDEVPAAGRHRRRDAALAVLHGVAVVGQATFLAWALADVVVGDAPLSLPAAIASLTASVLVRAGLSWARAASARRCAVTVVATLRGRLLDHAVRHAATDRTADDRGDLATTMTTGLDTLGPYYTGYRTALTAATTVPVVVVAGLVVTDWISAVVVAVTLPLVPLFGALVGAHTRERTARQWGLLGRLGGHFLDAVAGLPTLRAFGRAGHQVEVVRRIAEAHHDATMRVLRVAFLSSLVLELVATLSVALIAVPTGLRLLDGGIGLATALGVLFLAPEAYLPLRALGTAFHDSAGAVVTAESVVARLDGSTDPTPVTAGRTAPSHTAASRTPPALRLEGVTVRHPGRDGPALAGVDLVVARGERVGLVGPSGAGKSTLLRVVLGMTPPDRGRVVVDGTDLAELDRDAWRDRIAWVGQSPHLFAMSVAENIRLGRRAATLDQVRDAARAAQADGFVAALPDGYDTVLGENGAGLSTGQRQRVALARAFLRDAPLVLLDEPTANLDPRTEECVADAVHRLLAGRTALVVAHRPALPHDVDRIVHLHPGGPVEAHRVPTVVGEHAVIGGAR